MASPIKITRDNYTTNLVRSTASRAGTPDGNYFIDLANDVIEIITLEELATVNLGSGLEANPLTNDDKIQGLAIYFELLEQAESDTAVQNFLAAMDAAPNRLGKLTGATSFLNGIKLASGTVDAGGVGGSLGDDRFKIADSGFTEFAAGGGGNTLIDRVNHGAKSLNAILVASQPFYQIAASLSEADRQAAPPVDFSKTGDVNQVIQTFGATANGDAGAGDFDSRADVLILGVRTFGQTVGEANSNDTGVAELGAYSQGYGLGETPVPDLSGVTEADVFGGGIVAPYDGLTFDRVTVAETKTGFVEADGDFTDVIRNTGGASLVQVRAWLDKLMQQDTDQNVNTGTTGPFLPKRAEPLYTIDGTTLVTRQGLFIEGVSSGIINTDDAGAQKTYPFLAQLIIRLSAAWFNDAAPWFRMMYLDGAAAADFDTTGAVTLEDSAPLAIAGDELDSRIFSVNAGEYYELRVTYGYDTNTQAGLGAAIDKDFVFQCGGTATSKRRTVFGQITRDLVKNFDASTDPETN